MSELAELFARDPLNYVDGDIDTIVATLRKQRKRFVAGDKTAGSPKPPSAAKVKRDAINETVGKVDLSDLF